MARLTDINNVCESLHHRNKEKTATDDLTVVDCGREIPASGDNIPPASGKNVTAVFKVRSECRILSLQMSHFIVLNTTSK